MIRAFAAHPTIANLTMALLIVIGLVAVPSLLRETFPRISPRDVQVTIGYPGATPDTVARTICARIGDALDGIRHVEEVRCDAFESRAVAVVKMRPGGDFSRFTADVEAEIGAIKDLPDTTEQPIIERLGLSDLVGVVALTAPGAHDMTELKTLAENIKDSMIRWGGIPRVEVAGFSEPKIRIEIDEQAARSLGLSLDELASLIGRQNVDAPLGEVVSRERSTVLRFDAERSAADAYRDIVVASDASGAEVRLIDIARVIETVADPEVAVRLNGESAAILRVTKDETQDTLRVMEAIDSFIAHEQAQLPPGVVLKVTGDTAGVLDDRLTMLVRNSLQGLALVFAVIWLFFGARQAFWISAGLPVSFLGALAAMSLLGFSINMFTLVALLIVIGILMDDALVIAENIETKRAQGLPPLEAAVVGARQVAPGVVASFVTTAAVFGALAFLEGDLGEVLRVIPIVMLLVLIVSLVEAFLILPAHLSHGAPIGPDKQRAADKWLNAIRSSVVGPIARAAVSWRWLTLGIATLAFAASLAAIISGILKFQAFPDLDGDQIEARIALSAGVSVERTEDAIEYVLDRLDRVNRSLSRMNPDEQSLVQDVVVIIGENADVGGTGAHLATINVDLLDVETRGVTLDQILGAWQSETTMTPMMRRLSFMESAVGPAGRAIEIRLAHDDVATLDLAADKLRAWLGRYAGTYNLADDLSEGRPELRFALRDGAGALGLDARAVADQVRAGFQGATADVVQLDGIGWDIEVALRADDRDTMHDLEAFSIKTPSGARVPLQDAVTVEESRGYAMLRLIGGQPVVTVTGDVDTGLGNADEIVRDTITNFLPELKAEFPGLSTQIKGASAAADKTESSMMSGLIIGLLLIFMVLSIQLRTYSEPLVVMVLIPFALIGAVVGHLIMGIDMSMPSMLGFASLAGIVVNDSILLVHVIKDATAKGLSIAEAAPKAAEARFRAIFLTSVTTVVGVAPLMFETSLQAQPLIPMVTSIAFGLTATTLLMLLVVPAFYAVLDDLGLVKRFEDCKAPVGVSHREPQLLAGSTAADT